MEEKNLFKSTNIAIYLIATMLMGYFIWIFLNIEELSKYNLLIASFYIEPNAYGEFAMGLIVTIVLSLIVFLFLRPYFVFWLIKAFITLFVLILRESTRAFDPSNYYGTGVYYIEKYVFGSSGTANVMHITNFFSNFMGESYYSLKIFFSFIGFLGIVLFYKAFVHIMKRSNLSNIEGFKYWLFFLPSILLWTSNIGKDALMFFCVGLFTFGVVHLINKMNPMYFLIISLAMILAMYIRPWYPMIMIIALSLYYTNLRSIKSIFFLIILSPFLYIILIGMIGHFGIYSFDDMFLRMTSISTGFSRGGSSVDVNKITGLSSYLFYFIPNAFTALFRPMLFEVRNLGMLLSSMENILLLYLFFKYIIWNLREVMQNKYLKFLLIFIFAWLLLYVIPQGNLGTTIRFKVHVLPALIMLAYIGRQIILNKKARHSI